MLNNEISQYLTFNLHSENYAVSVLNVREVLEIVPITRVPGMPDFMKGVLNLRGSVVPVIDLRKKFGIKEEEQTIDTSIIILEINAKDNEVMLIGAFVDSVQEVIDIASSQIEPAPSIGLNLKSDFIQGMCQHNESFLIILDINKVLSTEELILLPNSSEVSKDDKNDIENS